MPNKIVTTAFTGAAAVGAVGLGAQPAHAASFWHVTPGGHVATRGVATVADVTTGATMTCSVGLSANLSGDGLTGAPVRLGSISKFGGSAPCSWLGIPFSLRIKRPVHVVASTYGNGVTLGKLTDVSLSVNATGTSCHASAAGSLPMSYRDGSHTLAVDTARAGTLTGRGVQGCLGGFHSGDTWYLSGLFPLAGQTISFG